jgi:hypothetical protein
LGAIVPLWVCCCPKDEEILAKQKTAKKARIVVLIIN